MSRRKQSNPKSVKSDIDPMEVTNMSSEDDWKNKLENISIKCTGPASPCDSDNSDINRQSEEGASVLPETSEDLKTTPEESAEMKKEISTPSPPDSPIKPSTSFEGLSQASIVSAQLLKNSLEQNQLTSLIQGIPLLSSVLPSLQSSLSQISPQVENSLTCVCGIKFVSTSNFEAHRNFYCTQRQGADSKEKKEQSRSPDKDSEEESSSNKLLRCPHCPYTSTHKLSLNGHMNIHTNPEEATVKVITTPSEPRVHDRYCVECDIQFASVKTFRVHKAHYCQTRHVLKGAKSPAREEMVGNSLPNFPGALPPGTPQPVLALPTNPVLLVPYSLLATAQLLPQYLPQTGAAFVLPDGQMHPLPSAPSLSRILPNLISPGSTNTTFKNSIPPSQTTNDSKPQKSEERQAKSPNKKSNDVQKRKTEPEIPLDLTTKKPKLSIKSNLLNEEEKENREINGDISPKSSKSPSVTGEFEGKLLVSPQISPIQNSEEQIQQSSQLKPQLTLSSRAIINSPKASTSSLTASRSPNHVSPVSSCPPIAPSPLLGAFPNPFLNMEALANLQCIQSLQNMPRDIALKLISPDTLINGVNPILSPPVMPKQGEALCEDCNITFQKEESLQIHKKHYCSGRENAKNDEERNTNSGRNSNASSSSETSHKSPKRDTTSKEPNKSKQLQYPCSNCGIKYSTTDNLIAHQTYYCPKRDGTIDDGVAKGLWRCPRCKVVMTETMQAAHQCVSPSSTPSQGWRCPMCPVLSQTATAAQKHLETHAGIKAFKCTICGYRGNTLRGMRTHIRIHFEKRSNEIQEENFIECILDEEPRSRNGTDTRKYSDNSRLLLENPSLSLLLNDRLANHIETPMKCPLCPFTSPTKSIFFQHLAITHNSMEPKSSQDLKTILEKNFTGSQDDEIMKSPSPLLKFEPQVKIEVDESPIQSDSESPSPSTSATVTSVYNQSEINDVGQCQTCNTSFKRFDSYISHRKYCSRPQSITPPETTVP